jgi:histidine triad (HIT) family protein
VTIFQKIIDKEIPADIVYEDDLVLAFKDINPQAPVHILVIPKKPIAKLSDMAEDDASLVGTLIYRATRIAEEQNIEDYRLTVNNGARAGQTVFHVHIHLMAGRAFSWPPG